MNGIASVLQELLRHVSNLLLSKEKNNIVEASMLYLILSTPIHPKLSNILMEKYGIKDKLEAYQLFSDSKVLSE